jgi:thiamine biosynthesis lipoprotein
MSLEEIRFEALGSDCHLLTVRLPAARLRRAQGWVLSMHQRLSRFLPDSELSRLNAAAGRWSGVSDELELLLRAALEAYESSGGLVHAGVLHSVRATGYTRSLVEGPTAGGGPPPPPPALPDMLQVAPGRARLRLGTGVDLGGLAKGWLADRLASELGANCLVNLGGDLFALGAGPDGRGWPVGVAGATLMLREQGAATSGTWRRSWRTPGRGGRLVHHLIDPRSGRPAASDLTEVSVVSESATAAEVHAKAALLLGSAEAPRYLRPRALAWSLS